MKNLAIEQPSYRWTKHCCEVDINTTAGRHIPMELTFLACVFFLPLLFSLFIVLFRVLSLSWREKPKKRNAILNPCIKRYDTG